MLRKLLFVFSLELDNANSTVPWSELLSVCIKLFHVLEIPPHVVCAARVLAEQLYCLVA